MGRSLGHAGELRVPGRRSDARLLIQSVALAERALALLGWIQSASREIVLNPEVPSELEAADPAAATKSHLRFPVVGIGASAGGISATLEFLKHSPASSGMAFVVVLHLSPRHDSNAAAILQRATRMPVVQVTGTEPIEPNRVYVIAPALHLTMDDGKLRVEALERPRGRHVAIDLFFRTLARAHGERAIAWSSPGRVPTARSVSAT